METKDFIANEEVIDTIEEIGLPNPSKGLKAGTRICLALFVSAVAYKLVIKPLRAKRKNGAKAHTIDDEVETIKADLIID